MSSTPRLLSLSSSGLRLITQLMVPSKLPFEPLRRTLERPKRSVKTGKSFETLNVEANVYLRFYRTSVKEEDVSKGFVWSSWRKCGVSTILDDGLKIIEQLRQKEGVKAGMLCLIQCAKSEQ